MTDQTFNFTLKKEMPTRDGYFDHGSGSLDGKLPALYDGVNYARTSNEGHSGNGTEHEFLIKKPGQGIRVIEFKMHGYEWNDYANGENDGWVSTLNFVWDPIGKDWRYDFPGVPPPHTAELSVESSAWAVAHRNAIQITHYGGYGQAGATPATATVYDTANNILASVVSNIPTTINWQGYDIDYSLRVKEVTVQRKHRLLVKA